MDTDAAKFRQLNRPPINFEVPCKSESVACSSLSLEAWKPKPSPAALPSSRRNKRIEGVLEVPERLLVNALGVDRPPTNRVRWVALGKASGIDMDQELWNLYVFDGEQVVRTVFCFDRARCAERRIRQRPGAGEPRRLAARRGRALRHRRCASCTLRKGGKDARDAKPSLFLGSDLVGFGVHSVQTGDG